MIDRPGILAWVFVLAVVVAGQGRENEFQHQGRTPYSNTVA